MNNPQNYIGSPLNKSKTKQAFSFSKQKRFLKQKKILTEMSYDIPTTKSRRACNFGYGNKISLANRSVSPPPDSYQIQSQFANTKQNAIGFGLSRQSVSFGDFLEAAKRLKRYPSPSQYSPKNYTFCKKGGRISDKLPTQLDLQKRKKVPGPGTYNFHGNQMNKSGSYILSSYKNRLSPRYHSISEPQKKSLNKNIKIPFYQTMQKEVGKYHLSQYKNNWGKTFTKAQRMGMQQKAKKYIPGCKYRSFSQFGGNFS